VGLGTGSGAGVDGTGGTSNATGVKGTGGTTNGIGIQGYGVGTGAGVEGNGASSPIATAATTGSGVVGRGGQSNGYGGEFFGKGSGSAVFGTGVNGFGVEGTSSTNIGVKGTGGTNQCGVSGLGTGNGSGILGTGGSTSGSLGVEGTSNATNGTGVKGTGTGTGYGVWGVGVDGHGVVAQSATSPTKSSLLISPQSSDPNSAKGSVYVNSTSGRISVSDGQTWHRLVGCVKHITDRASKVMGASVTEDVVGYEIPANTLRVGTVIKVKAVSTLSAVSYVSGGIVPGIIFGSEYHYGYGLANTVDQHFIETTVVVRSIGAAGTAYMHSVIIPLVDAPSTPLTAFGTTISGLDTTAEIGVWVRAYNGSTTGTLAVDLFNVEISD
jgi:hypothetical protein